MSFLSSLMNALPGAAAQGLAWGIMAIGVYITFRILDVADLTVDGSLATGGAVCVMLIRGGFNPWIALLCAMLAGMLAGLVTGLFHTRCGIPAILAGILTQLALYSINLRIMDSKANQALSVDKYPLLLSQRYVRELSMNNPLPLLLLFTAAVIAILYWFFGTEKGSSLRATGANPHMARAQGINTNSNIVLGLMVSNGLVALSGALLAQYQGATPYPGKAVVEQGMTLIGGILDRRGDNVAMLEAFTRAEDELLDWKEDFAEVDFFFKNQAGVFRDAVRLSEQAERDSHYFADEPQAVEAAKAIRAIIQMQRPYREVRRLPELKAAVQQAYARISDARRARVEETVVQARGDVHTLAGDEPELRGDIRKIDEQLEAFKARALEAESPVELDAIITQIFTYRDGQCRRLEQLLAGLHGQNAPSLRVKTIRRYDVLPQKRLSSAAEIEAYVEQLKQKLLQELAENDAIQMN